MFEETIREEVEKFTKYKKSIAVAIILICGLFILMMFLNKGTLVIKAEIPYKVSAGKMEVFCDINPCELELEKGNYEVTLAKEGHRNVNFEIALKAHDTIERKVEFELIPFVEKLSEEKGAGIFKASSKPEVKIDQKEGHKQALYVGDEVAAYFNIPIKAKNLEFLNDGKTVAVITEDGAVYLIDSKEKTRIKLTENTEITGLKCSFDTSFCLIKGSETVLINAKTLAESKYENLKLPFEQMAWDKQGRLYSIGQYESEESDGAFFVQRFDTGTGEFTNILNTYEIESAPLEVKADKEVYVRTRDGYYAIKF